MEAAAAAQNIASRYIAMEYKHIKAHQGKALNEFADSVCTAAHQQPVGSIDFDIGGLCGGAFVKQLGYYAMAARCAPLSLPESLANTVRGETPVQRGTSLIEMPSSALAKPMDG